MKTTETNQTEAGGVAETAQPKRRAGRGKRRLILLTFATVLTLCAVRMSGRKTPELHEEDDSGV